jgi:hypothetical protein
VSGKAVSAAGCFFVFGGGKRLGARRLLAHTLRLTPGGGHQPGAHAFGLVDALQVLYEQSEGALEDIGALVVVEAGAPRDGIDEALVAVDQALPGAGVTLAAGGQQRTVVAFIVPGKDSSIHVGCSLHWRAHAQAFYSKSRSCAELVAGGCIFRCGCCSVASEKRANSHGRAVRRQWRQR